MALETFHSNWVARCYKRMKALVWSWIARPVYKLFPWPWIIPMVDGRSVNITQQILIQIQWNTANAVLLRTSGWFFGNHQWSSGYVQSINLIALEWWRSHKLVQRKLIPYRSIIGLGALSSAEVTLITKCLVVGIWPVIWYFKGREK